MVVALSLLISGVGVRLALVRVRLGLDLGECGHALFTGSACCVFQGVNNPVHVTRSTSRAKSYRQFLDVFQVTRSACCVLQGVYEFHVSGSTCRFLHRVHDLFLATGSVCCVLQGVYAHYIPTGRKLRRQLHGVRPLHAHEGRLWECAK